MKKEDTEKLPKNIFIFRQKALEILMESTPKMAPAILSAGAMAQGAMQLLACLLSKTEASTFMGDGCEGLVFPNIDDATMTFAALLMLRCFKIHDKDTLEVGISPKIVSSAMEDFNKLTGRCACEVIHPKFVEMASMPDTTPEKATPYGYTLQ